MKILIIIDAQNGFTKNENTRLKAKEIVSLSKSNKFDYIIATRFFNKPNSEYVKSLNWKKMFSGDETKLVDGLHYDECINKSRYTAINAYSLKLLKKINNNVKPSEVYICGIDTDCCVLKTATDLFDNNIRPIVLIQYCDSNGGLESHNAAIKVMERTIGKKQICYDKFI